MGDIDRGLFRPPLQIENRILQGIAEIAVERGERLIEKQHTRVGGEHARQRYALLLAAGELPRHAVAEAGHLDHVQHFLDPLIVCLLGFRCICKSERNVLGDRQMRKERVALEGQPDIALVRGHVGSPSDRRT